MGGRKRRDYFHSVPVTAWTWRVGAARFRGLLRNGPVRQREAKSSQGAFKDRFAAGYLQPVTIAAKGTRTSVTFQVRPSRVRTNTTGSPSALSSVAVKREVDS
jgi:hypothetical protein